MRSSELKTSSANQIFAYIPSHARFPLGWDVKGWVGWGGRVELAISCIDRRKDERAARVGDVRASHRRARPALARAGGIISPSSTGIASGTLSAVLNALARTLAARNNIDECVYLTFWHLYRTSCTP